MVRREALRVLDRGHAAGWTSENAVQTKFAEILFYDVG